MAEHRELGDVPAEEERGRPVDDDPELAREERKLEEVVAAGDEPAGEAPEAQARSRRRSPCSGRASPPGRAFGRRTAVACPSGSSPACEPGGARAGRSAGRRGRGSPRSGRAAQSPSAQTRSRPSTRRNRSTRTRPRSSSGRPNGPSSGWARTPAVQTSVCVAIRSPSDSVASVAETESSVVDVRISTPRRGAHAPRTPRDASGSPPGSSALRRRAPSAAGCPAASDTSAARP